MKYLYNVGDVLYLYKGEMLKQLSLDKLKCKIIEQFHLIYEGKYPTYKIEFFDNIDSIYFHKKLIAPECFLKQINNNKQLKKRNYNANEKLKKWLKGL